MLKETRNRNLKRAQCRFVQIRSQFGGTFIVELLVAILVSSIMGAAVVNSMSDSLRVTTKAQNQVIATAIAQQVIDACRNRPFDDLVTVGGANGCLGMNQSLVVNGTASSTYPAIFPRPLIMRTDDNAATYHNESSGNRFQGTAIADVATVGDVDPDTGRYNTANVAVTIRWNEGGSTGQRRYRMSANITRFGLRSN